MLFDYLPLILQATGLTLHLALVAFLFGLVLSLLFLLMEMTPWQAVNKFNATLIALMRGLPEILVVFLIYFGLPEILEMITGQFIELSAFTCGTIALAIIFAAYASQTLRGAMIAIPKGQWEAASALGFNRYDTFLRFILPQIWRHALPGLSNQWLVLLKDTALVSLVGLTDLTRQAQLITATTHQPFTYFAIVGLIYLAITLISQVLIRKIELYLSRFERPMC